MGREVEGEMEQLLNMGFPEEVAAQALAATGGKSALKATEWILSQTQKSSDPNDNSPNDNDKYNPTSPPPALVPSSSSQPKLDRFFHLQSKPTSISTPTSTPSQQRQKQPPAPVDTKKRPWPSPEQVQVTVNPPLSERMRPRTLDDVVGQDHLSPLLQTIQCDRLPSIILWGPPGTGKTSIARAISNSSSSSSYRFVSLSAVTCGIKDIREAVEGAKKNNNRRTRTVLFVDEVHRFNKSQQDSFLPIIEDGTVVFIGATTENPSFHLVTPLLSRCTVLTLNPLNPDHVQLILNRAISDVHKGLPKTLPLPLQLHVHDDAVQFLSHNCDGDARVALNALEIAVSSAFSRVAKVHLPESNSGAVLAVSLDDAKEALQCKHLAYDRSGEEHYNLISALHKSMRGSDANASIYWLARMLEGGEQPLYIARRLIRFASEDVGLADPLALNQAVACYHACHFLGMPECNVVLAQCVAYLALAPKSISVYRAIEAAQKAVRDSVGQNKGVPMHLRNAPTKLMKELGYGKGYIYTPDDPFTCQSYLPPSLQGYKFLDWPPRNQFQQEPQVSKKDFEVDS